MAAKKPAYEAEREYDVRLKRVVWLGAARLLPRDRHLIRGDVLNDAGQVPPEAVDEAVPLQLRERSPEAVAALEESAAKLAAEAGPETILRDAEA